MFILFLFCSFNGNCQTKIQGLPSCIEIGFKVSDNTFPTRWYNAKINARAEPLSKSEIEDVNEALIQTLSKYPEKVICSYLKRIFVFKNMRFYNVPFGGTSSKDAVYITNDEENFTCSYDLLETYFHHEFSSILLNKNGCKFQKKKWKSLNPEGFHYGKGGLNAILTGNAEMNFDPQLNERGFLTRYSEASLEEDFNVFCQNVFNGGFLFWKLVDKIPAIKLKADLVIQFDHRIDPQFSESYFRKINQK